MTEERNQPLSVDRSAQTTTIELAIAYTKERKYDEALRYFQQAGVLSPEGQSYYGLALAIRRRDLDGALRHCREALDQEPLRGDFYHNLGQVYLARGEKKKAVQVFFAGLQAAHRHAGLAEALKRLGIRRPPMVPFLSRTNPVNKYLGWIRYHITIGLKKAA